MPLLDGLSLLASALHPSLSLSLAAATKNGLDFTFETCESVPSRVVAVRVSFIVPLEGLARISPQENG